MVYRTILIGSERPTDRNPEKRVHAISQNLKYIYDHNATA